VFITHTGGTTGIPKLVEQSVTGASAVVNVESRRWLFGYSPSETVGSCLTFVHGRAIYQMTAFLSRGTRFVAVCDPDPENVRSTFATHKPTIVESHPNTFLRWESLCSDPSQPFGNVRLYYNSFDAMHPRMIRHLLDASRRRLPLYCQGYGMSEVGVISLRLYTRRSIRRLGRMGMGSRNVGWPLPGDSRVRIVDGDTMRPVLRGSSGRIQVRSRGLTAGFAEQEEKYWARRHGDWFDTGDIGRQGPFGSVELLDREVDRIEGIDSCIGVEDVLFDRLPELREVVIVGDDEGEPVPIVVMKGDQQLDLQEWNLATADFPTLRAPVQVEEMDLPRTASDKARRFIVSHRLDHDSGAGELPPLRDGA
jgi:acyl-coenzyme A synthetase/AMP-(fatty) acid ligase